jgi:hypothetical protein
MPSETLLAAAGILGGVVALMVDGRRAVVIAVVAAGGGLLPSVASLSGGPGTLVVGGAMLAAVLGGWVARLLALKLRWVAGLDPLVPAFAPPDALFGPRSVRAAAAAVAVPAASWVSFNVAIGPIAPVSGVLFPMAYIWACGALRLIVGRTVEDLAVGVAMVAAASAATWLVRSGGDLGVAAAIAAVAPLSALAAGWLSGRHQRRASPA